jgi:hypothetical protein
MTTIPTYLLLAVLAGYAMGFGSGATAAMANVNRTWWACVKAQRRGTS